VRYFVPCIIYTQFKVAIAKVTEKQYFNSTPEKIMYNHFMCVFTIRIMYVKKYQAVVIVNEIMLFLQLRDINFTLKQTVREGYTKRISRLYILYNY